MKQIHRPRRMWPAVALLSAAIVVAIAGCGPAAGPSKAGPTPEPTEAAFGTRSSEVAGAASSATASSSGQPTTSGQRVSGTVQTIEAGKVVLTDGQTLTLGPDTQVIRLRPATAADLKPEDYVAITATREPDGTLLASVVNIFAESQRGVGAGQRPMAGGNLMTNATITTVSGDSFAAIFPGGTATVRLAPGARLQRFVSSAPGDIAPGMTISALVANGVARSITLQ